MILPGPAFIRCPFPEEGGDPNCFDLDWLHQCAVHMATQNNLKGIPKSLDNTFFKRYVKFMRLMNTYNAVNPDRRLFTEYLEMYQAFRWQSHDEFLPLKQRIIPLLLTAATLDMIATHCAVPRIVLHTFCKLFFDIRDENGDTVRGEMLKHIVALGGLLELPENATAFEKWRFQAIHPTGYMILSNQFGFNKKDETAAEKSIDKLAQLAEVTLTSRIVSEHISNEDLLGVINQKQNQQKIDADEDKTTEQSEGWDMVRSLMQVMAPHKPDKPPSQEALDASNAAIRSKLSAANAIKSADPKDKGIAAGAAGIMPTGKRAQRIERRG